MINRSSTLALLASLTLVGAASAADPADAKKVDFVKDVQPIFKASCVNCHSLDPKKPMKKGAGGLRLDDKAAALKGGKRGAVIIPGRPDESMLFKLLSGPVSFTISDDDEKEIPPMPKVKRGETFKPLTGAQIATIRLWIDQGAAWPDAM